MHLCLTSGTRVERECSSYVVDGNDPAFPQQQKALLVVAVVAHLVGIDEDKVEGFSLAGRKEIICKKRDGSHITAPATVYFFKTVESS